MTLLYRTQRLERNVDECFEGYGLVAVAIAIYQELRAVKAHVIVNSAALAW